MLGSKTVVSAALTKSVLPTNLILPIHYIVLTALPTQLDKVLGTRLALLGSNGAEQTPPHTMSSALGLPIERKNVNKLSINKAKQSFLHRQGSVRPWLDQLNNLRNEKKASTYSQSYIYMLCWIRAVHHKPSAQPQAESSSPSPKPCASGSRLSSAHHSPHAWHSQQGRHLSCSLAQGRGRMHSAARPQHRCSSSLKTAQGGDPR